MFFLDDSETFLKFQTYSDAAGSSFGLVIADTHNHRIQQGAQPYFLVRR